MTQHNPECGLDCVSAGAVRKRTTRSADQSAERKHLAAAAPEMLEALKDALEALDWHAINFEPHGSGGKTIRQIVRATIAKAEGRQS